MLEIGRVSGPVPQITSLLLKLFGVFGRMFSTAQGVQFKVKDMLKN